MNTIDDKLSELEKQLNEKIHMLNQYNQYSERSDYDDYDEHDYSTSPEEDIQEDINNISNAINKLQYEKERAEASIDFNKFKSTYKSGNILTDKQTSKDVLNRDIYADSISRLIANKETETPLTVGVFGEWGKGKSSFLDLLETKLKSLYKKNTTTKNMYSEIHIIRFDASEYNQETKIWYSFLKELCKEFEREKPIVGKFCFAFKKFKRSFKENILKYIINMIILITVMIISQRGVLKIIQSNIALKSLGVLSILLFFTNILIPLIKKQLEFIKPLSEKVNKIFNLLNYTKYLGIRETIKEDFKDIIDIWLKKEKKNDNYVYEDKIVILVDELDRCSEKTITEFFNALQLILPIEGLIVVLSVNYETVCYSLANNNKHYFDTNITNEQKIDFGINYLDKYINIPFYLPAKIEYKNYLNMLLEKELSLNTNGNRLFSLAQEESAASKDNSELAIFTNEEVSLIKETIENINSFLEITPREIKKIINLLIISKDICFNINLKIKNKFQFKNYISWFLFAYFNPSTANIISNMDYDDYYKLESHYFKDDEKSKKFFDQISKLKNLNFRDVRICNRISRCFILDVNKLKRIS